MSDADGARPPPSRPPPLKTRSLSRQYSSEPVWVEEMVSTHATDSRLLPAVRAVGRR